MSAAPLLLVEDDPHIARFVQTALSSAGHTVTVAPTVAQATEHLAQTPPSLLVLDLGLPDGDGVTLLRALRTWSSMPVLVLSARAHEHDKIEALDAGADDYLVKPFSVGELQARVRAMLRRATRQTDDEQPVRRFGDVEVDLVRRQVRKAGEAVKLTPIEYQLLCVLMAHAGRVITHRQLLKDVWGPGHADHSHYLRVYVGHLRHKLEDDPTQPRHFLTEVGVGYRFALEG